MDSSARLAEAVQEARSHSRRLSIVGAGSKRSWLPPAAGEMLSMSEHAGIVAYDPAELVVTARAGTPIKDLLAELAQLNQTLGFEPPLFFGAGTVGGMVSTGLSGPARPWSGSVSDAVLGVKIINGLGETLSFGGQVMKNVAGYDVSRLMAGAYGALGVLLEVSVRVQPVAERTVTLQFELPPADALAQCRALAQRYLPLSGQWWHDGRLYLRLSGAAAAVELAGRELGGEPVDGASLWGDVRDHQLAFFKAATPASFDRAGHKLWRMVVPPAAALPDCPGETFAMEWAGGLRWLWHDDDRYVADYVARNGGWAWALSESVPVQAMQQKYMRAVKAAFDPHGVFSTPLGLAGESDAH